MTVVTAITKFLPGTTCRGAPPPSYAHRMSSGAGSVAVVVAEEIGFPSWDLYELSIPLTVFGKPQPDLSDHWYDLRLCATGERDGSGGEFGLALRTPYGSKRSPGRTPSS